METTTRAEAKARGLKKYFTGKLCLRGHVAERFVSCKKCTECQKEDGRKWRKGNPEKSREISHKWYVENRQMPILAINEVYGPTIQGEGRSQGMPCIFLRTSTCNLHCNYCDTPFTWNWTDTPWKHPDKFDPKKEIHKVESGDLTEQLKAFGEKFKIKFLVVTGGEPLLQQTRLVSVLEPLKKDDWWIEVETNGTKMPTKAFAACIAQFNVSPKLRNAGDLESMRIVPSVLKELAGGDKCLFKFVVKTYADAEEISALVSRFQIPPERVWLMPEGRTREELAVTEPVAALTAKNKGWNYTDRRHILLFGNRRKV